MHLHFFLLCDLDCRCFSIGDTRGLISNEVSNVFIYVGLSNIFIPYCVALEDGKLSVQMSRARILKRL